MFSCCKNLTSLDVSMLDTSGAKDFTCMFSFCEKLTEIIGLENFDVKKVTNFYETFYSTESLENFDVED
ncbi:MAG: DUF285 domain-containing protein [Clostridia bacterium]|nr:DUF285 domain-containing protein [Clostridia bacterium]